MYITACTSQQCCIICTSSPLPPTHLIAGCTVNLPVVTYEARLRVAVGGASQLAGDVTRRLRPHELLWMKGSWHAWTPAAVVVGAVCRVVTRKGEKTARVELPSHVISFTAMGTSWRVCECVCWGWGCTTHQVSRLCVCVEVGEG